MKSGLRLLRSRCDACVMRVCVCVWVDWSAGPGECVQGVCASGNVEQIVMAMVWEGDSLGDGGKSMLRCPWCDCVVCVCARVCVWCRVVRVCELLHYY